MPLPRFEKLPEDKQERILEAAARVFTANRYEKASLNLMLEEAGISKGAAYYYFADKADLVATLVRHYWLDSLVQRGTTFSELTADTYWETVADLYQHPLTDVEERPWLLGLSRSLWELPHDLLKSGPLKGVAEEAADWMAALLQRGRELGLVRNDLPDDLLIRLIWTLDGVHDKWLGSHWTNTDGNERERITRVFVSFLRKILEPPTDGEEAA